MNKYKLTDETKEYCGHIYHRIQALIDIGDSVKAGDLGGFVESESNLIQHGICWIHNNAMVGEDCVVHNNCQVGGNAKLTGKVTLWDDVVIEGNIELNGSARIVGNLEIFNEI